jgi:hypothetical protein
MENFNMKLGLPIKSLHLLSALASSSLFFFSEDLDTLHRFAPATQQNQRFSWGQERIWFRRFFIMDIFLAGWSVLATPLLTSSILYF